MIFPPTSLVFRFSRKPLDSFAYIHINAVRLDQQSGTTCNYMLAKLDMKRLL